jgi:hypothetical protein
MLSTVLAIQTVWLLLTSVELTQVLSYQPTVIHNITGLTSYNEIIVGTFTALIGLTGPLLFFVFSLSVITSISLK